MRLTPLTLIAACIALSPTFGHAQTSEPQTAPAAPSIGTWFDEGDLRDLPLGYNLFSLLETTQSEVISDRFNSGGLRVLGDARVGGFLGSWSQTRFRIGDIDVSDPAGSGSPLLFPNTVPWADVGVTTGMMPAEFSAPGLAVTLQPRRGGKRWTRLFELSGSGGSLAAGPPSGHPIPVARLRDFGHGSVVASGPLTERVGLAASATWSHGTSLQRERAASLAASNGSATAHLTVAVSPAYEWRTLAWVQRGESPHDEWRLLGEPSASTSTDAVHLQSTVEHVENDAARWRVFGGFSQRNRDDRASSRVVVTERIVDGPIPNIVDALADSRSRRISVGARYARATGSSSRHRVDAGVDVESASTRTSDMFTGVVRETVDGIPARTWAYSSSAQPSRRQTTALSGFLSDAVALTSSATLDVGVRADVVRGSADGSGDTLSWVSALPHAYLTWRVSDRRAFLFGYSRSAHALNTSWLAYSDPAAPTALVASATNPTVVVARVGPGTGGSATFSRIDESTARPYTDEFVVGLERRRGPSTRYTLTGIARRQTNSIGIVNTGVTSAGYVAIDLADAGKDLVDPSDDRMLTVFNRLPSTFGRDLYVLTNTGVEPATAFALRMSWERRTERLFMLFGATASAAQGSGGNPGYGPLENDQDVLGTLLTNPNASSYARGRLFSDRAFTIKWTTRYRFPKDVTVSGIARYQDGQPFSRLVVVPSLNQGAEAVQAYPNAGSRFTFTGTLDVRVQKGLRLGRTRVDAILDAYNLLTRNNEVEERVVSGATFRTPTAIQPPASVHLGVRLSF